MAIFHFFWKGLGLREDPGATTGTANGTSTATGIAESFADATGTANGSSTASGAGDSTGAAAELVGRQKRRRGRYKTPAPWAADEAYAEIRTQPEIRQELRRIVEPYLLAGTLPPRATPPTSGVDWDALMHDTEAVYRLVVLWEEVVEEEETLLLLDM